MRCYSSIISNPVKEGENYPNFDVRYMKHLASIRLSYLEKAKHYIDMIIERDYS